MQGGRIFIYQSKDDPVVNVADARKYKTVLPEAALVLFNKKGHFNEEKFPELVRTIKKLF